jgi:hypothetical protein
MPTLFRFLGIILTLAAIAGGAILALATFGVPTPRPMTVDVQLERQAR